MSRPVLVSDAAAQLVYTPALSVAHVSIWDTRLRAFDFASASWPFFCWPRKAGRAIAARMPMIRITTRSSMSVKPFSSLLIRWESFRSIGHSSLSRVPLFHERDRALATKIHSARAVYPISASARHRLNDAPVRIQFLQPSPMPHRIIGGPPIGYGPRALRRLVLHAQPAARTPERPEEMTAVRRRRAARSPTARRA